MLKSKGLYDHYCRYNPDWEKILLWFRKCNDGFDKAFCKFCHHSFAPELDTLSKHEKSLKYKKKVPILGQQQLRVTKTTKHISELSKDVKNAELQLCVDVACYCSILAVDHLGEILETTLGSTGKNSTLGKIKMNSVVD